jgi:glycosyltransferase involved in cell wall biosynthesis
LLVYYFNMFLSFWRVRGFLKKELPDIMHVVSGGYPAAESLRAAVLAARFCGVPRRILTFHNQAMPLPPWGLSFAETWIDRNVEKSLDGIIAASQSSRRILIERRHFNAKHISLIYNGIASEEQGRKTISDLRRAVGVPVDARLIGTIGFLQTRKGHTYLLDAFKKIADQEPKAHLLIIGSGPLSHVLMDQIRQLGLAGRVSMPGYLVDATRFLAAMDVFVLPSTAHECLPYVVLYAMEAALPIVATTVGGVGEQIENGVSGQLVPPEDSSALAEAMRGILQDVKTAARMGGAARERLRERFSLDRMIDETERLYVGAHEKN